jgi:hypothetical protein
MAEWLALHLFDRLPDGVPQLDDEADDAEARTDRLPDISRCRPTD